MALKRVIPCLDVDRGRVVKGTNRPACATRPGRTRRALRRRGADELVFLDITASARAPRRRRARPADRRQCLHPVHDRRRHPLGRRRPSRPRRGSRQGLGQLLGARAPGADPRARRVFGSQCVVIAIDAKRRDRGRRARHHPATLPRGTSGRTRSSTSTSTVDAPQWTGREAVAWAREAVERGAGEVLLTSMDRDGTTDGYELALIRAVADAVGVPVIASGRAGRPSHLVEAVVDVRRTRCSPRRLSHLDSLEWLKRNGQ